MSRRTLQRWRRRPEDLRRGPKNHARKLSLEEANAAVAVACSEEFFDLPPMRVVAKLAERGEYVASPSTLWRLLKKDGLCAHRSRAKRPSRAPVRVSIATSPNQIWCWDISNLPADFGRYKLYLHEDLYSRKVVGWAVEEKECDEIATQAFERALAREGIDGSGLRLHSDNGAPMRGAYFIERLRTLGVVPSFSRPQKSDDNAFVESFFKTMKYSPRYPTKPFASLESARAWVERFVDWYNAKHLHSGIGYVTPDTRHERRDQAIQEQRRTTFTEARKRNPLRWSRKPYAWPEPPLPQLNPWGQRMLV